MWCGGIYFQRSYYLSGKASRQTFCTTLKIKVLMFKYWTKCLTQKQQSLFVIQVLSKGNGNSLWALSLSPFTNTAIDEGTIQPKCGPQPMAQKCQFRFLSYFRNACSGNTRIPTLTFSITSATGWQAAKEDKGIKLTSQEKGSASYQV